MTFACLNQARARTVLGALALVALAVPCSRAQQQSAPLDVAHQFIASGFMGDTDNIQLFESWIDTPFAATDADSACIKVTYTPGSVGYAGIYWQNRANNWGDYPGQDLSKSRYTSVVFWARGQTGREWVEFKAGDIKDPKKKYRDSFAATTGKVHLTREWRRYEIPLAGCDLSSVIGGFCWVASGNANPRGLTIYVDGISYR